MREYVFIDEKHLALFSQQISPPSQKKHIRKKNIGLSIAGPKIEFSEENDSSPPNTHEKIENLINELKERDLLSYRRPIRHPDPDEGRPFVLEETEACRLILPQSAIEHTPGIQDFAVWVSDPTPAELSTEEYEWTGSFLYLTEIWLDENHGGH
ncbi:MAG TPA: hypothetical protein VEY88_20015, partial [Archangium sp.]|nr:hypothetical protein [Archangium sp.]